MGFLTPRESGSPLPGGPPSSGLGLARSAPAAMFDGEAVERATPATASKRRLSAIVLLPAGLAALASAVAYLVAPHDVFVGVAYTTGGVALLIPTVAAVLAVANAQLAHWRRMRIATPVQAQIVRIEQVSVGGLSAKALPWVRFVATDGSAHEAMAGFSNIAGIPDRKLAAGEVLTVRYDPADPTWAVIPGKPWWELFARRQGLPVAWIAGVVLVLEVNLIVHGVHRLLGS